MCQVLGQPRDFSGQLFLYRQAGADVPIDDVPANDIACSDDRHGALSPLDCSSLEINEPGFR
jgi:hypothetical protein